jgi:hypothetical protein
VNNDQTADKTVDLDGSILNLTKLGTRVHEATGSDQDIPEPGSEENPWIGVDRVVNGQKQFYAFSGAERRRLIRADKRAHARQQAKGQRAYNRQERKREFDAGTVRQQLRIITGELQVSPAMLDNLQGHILRQTRLNTRADGAEDRRRAKAARREARLNQRRIARIDANRPRHADLVFAGERAF